MLYPARERKNILTRTPFLTQSAILSELWTTRRSDPDWSGFFNENDLALPLAHAINTGTINATQRTEELVHDAFTDLLAAVNAEALDTHASTTLTDILTFTKESTDDGRHGLATEVAALAEFWAHYKNHPSLIRTAAPHTAALALAYAWDNDVITSSPELLDAIVDTYTALAPVLQRLGLVTR